MEPCDVLWLSISDPGWHYFYVHVIYIQQSQQQQRLRFVWHTPYATHTHTNMEGAKSPSQHNLFANNLFYYILQRGKRGKHEQFFVSECRHGPNMCMKAHSDEPVRRTNMRERWARKKYVNVVIGNRCCATIRILGVSVSCYAARNKENLCFAFERIGLVVSSHWKYNVYLLFGWELGAWERWKCMLHICFCWGFLISPLTAWRSQPFCAAIPSNAGIVFYSVSRWRHGNVLLDIVWGRLDVKS